MSKGKIDQINIEEDQLYAPYRAARKLLHELGSKNNALRDKIRSLQEEHAAACAKATVKPLSPHDEVAVSALLGDTARDDAGATKVQLTAAIEELRIAELAAARQQVRVEEAKRDADEAARGLVLEEHRELARAIVRDLKVMRSALLAERSFRDKLDAKGIYWGPPLMPAAIPLSYENCERINVWLKEFEVGEKEGRYQIC